MENALWKKIVPNVSYTNLYLPEICKELHAIALPVEQRVTEKQWLIEL